MHLHRQVLAAAERAADAGEVDAHLLGREVETRCDLVAVDVEPLRRDVDVDRRPRRRERRARTRARGTPDPGCRCRRRPRPRRRPSASGSPWRITMCRTTFGPVVLAIAVTVRRPVGMEVLELGRALHVGHRRERLVVDADLLGRAPRLLGVLGGDERDRLAVVEDAVDREHRLVGELEPVVLGTRARRRGSAPRGHPASSPPR